MRKGPGHKINPVFRTFHRKTGSIPSRFCFALPVVGIGVVVGHANADEGSRAKPFEAPPACVRLPLQNPMHTPKERHDRDNAASDQLRRTVAVKIPARPHNSAQQQVSQQKPGTDRTDKKMIGPEHPQAWPLA